MGDVARRYPALNGAAPFSLRGNRHRHLRLEDAGRSVRPVHHVAGAGPGRGWSGPLDVVRGGQVELR
jgi:hypothetical protein